VADVETHLVPEHPASEIRKQADTVLASGKTLSVIIPAYNESKRIGQTFREVRAWLDEQFAGRYEVIVVEDGSRDNTAELVAEEAKKWPQLRLLRHPFNIGKGAAVRRGCLAARSDYVLFMDADHATPIEELRAFFPKLEQGFEIVAGVRTFQESESRSRRIIGLSLLILAHLFVFNKAVVDSQCGFKLFPRDVCRKVFSRCRINGGMIDVEMFHLAHHLGLHIWFAPVYWDNKAGSTINVLRCMINDPFDLLAIRWRSMRGVYNTPVARQPWQTGPEPVDESAPAPQGTGGQ
jgi:dolichyl-phosphate beta-glucosyltransferase